MAGGVVLVVGKEEQLVLNNGAAEITAQAVLVVTRVLPETLVLQALVDSVQVPVIQVVEDRAMILVGSRLDDGKLNCPPEERGRISAWKRFCSTVELLDRASFGISRSVRPWWTFSLLSTVPDR